MSVIGQAGVSRQRRGGRCSFREVHTRTLPVLAAEEMDRTGDLGQPQRCDVTPGQESRSFFRNQVSLPAGTPQRKVYILLVLVQSIDHGPGAPSGDGRRRVVDEGKNRDKEARPRAKPMVGETQWEKEDGR